jgi:hypothetical protein
MGRALRFFTPLRMTLQRFATPIPYTLLLKCGSAVIGLVADNFVAAIAGDYESLAG